MKRKKRKLTSLHRQAKLPPDAKLEATREGDTIYRGSDGSWYLVRNEPVVYRIAARVR